MRKILIPLALLAASPALAQGDPKTPIDAERLAEDVKTLASDAFEGRGPGTPGETKTVAYLIERFKALGLEPGGENGGWTQRVDLLRTKVGTPETLEVAIGGARTPWTFAKDVYVTSLQPADRAAIDKAEMVFVGYGIAAPERPWDDFGSVDLKGKVAVFLVNDPDFEAKEGDPVAGKFAGRAMTYYGRWTYKFEEAARRGAIGALIVHDTPGAGYGWSTVIAGGGENYDIARKPEDVTSLQLQGWISGEAATDLFKRAGLDLAAERARARTDAFTAIPLKGATFSAAFPVEQRVVESRNVLAKIGGKRPDESVMIGAHWDAYGIGTPDAEGRTVRAGANDDAIGLAAMFEIARAFKAGPQPDRTIVFGAWTAEERGLLGSEYYALNPLYPLDKTAANLTVDVLQTAGLARDVILIGKGQSSLEDDLARLAKAQDRTVTPDSAPERGLFYRADHFSLAKRGVPVLLMMGLGGGADLVEGGRAAGEAWVADYTAKRYHTTGDRYDETWNLAGAVQDIDLVWDLARELAFSNRWPTWKAGSEFRELRDKSAARRK